MELTASKMKLDFFCNFNNYNMAIFIWMHELTFTNKNLLQIVAYST